MGEEQSDEVLIEADTQVLVQQEQDIVESVESVTTQVDLTATLQELSDKVSGDEDLGDLLDIDDDEIDFMDFLSPEGENDSTIQLESEDDMDLKGEVTIDAKQMHVSEAVAETKPVCPQPVVAAKSDQDDAPPSSEPEVNDDEEVDFMDFL